MNNSDNGRSGEEEDTKMNGQDQHDPKFESLINLPREHFQAEIKNEINSLECEIRNIHDSIIQEVLRSTAHPRMSESHEHSERKTPTPLKNPPERIRVRFMAAVLVAAAACVMGILAYVGLIGKSTLLADIQRAEQILSVANESVIVDITPDGLLRKEIEHEYRFPNEATLDVEEAARAVKEGGLTLHGLMTSRVEDYSRQRYEILASFEFSESITRNSTSIIMWKHIIPNSNLVIESMHASVKLDAGDHARIHQEPELFAEFESEVLGTMKIDRPAHADEPVRGSITTRIVCKMNEQEIMRQSSIDVSEVALLLLEAP